MLDCIPTLVNVDARQSASVRQFRTNMQGNLALTLLRLDVVVGVCFDALDVVQQLVAFL